MSASAAVEHVTAPTSESATLEHAVSAGSAARVAISKTFGQRDSLNNLSMHDISLLEKRRGRMTIREAILVRIYTRTKHIASTVSARIVGDLTVLAIWCILVVCAWNATHWSVFVRIAEACEQAVVLGALLFFLITFYNQNSEDRWWEGRRCWGSIACTCVTLVQRAALWFPEEAIASDFTRFVIAYAYCLKSELRDETEFEQLEGILAKSQRDHLATMSVSDARLLIMESMRACLLSSLDALPAAEEKFSFSNAISQLERLLDELLSESAACIRIKITPIPLGHEGFMITFSWIYLGVLPWGLLMKLGPFVILPTVLAGWLMLGMIEMAQMMQQPFEPGPENLDLNEFCNGIRRQCSSCFARIYGFLDETNTDGSMGRMTVMQDRSLDEPDELDLVFRNISSISDRDGASGARRARISRIQMMDSRLSGHPRPRISVHSKTSSEKRSEKGFNECGVIEGIVI